MTDEYKKLTENQQCLLRPDMYIGSNVMTNEELYVYDSEEKKIIPKTISYNQAFERIRAGLARRFQTV